MDFSRREKEREEEKEDEEEEKNDDGYGLFRHTSQRVREDTSSVLYRQRDTANFYANPYEEKPRSYRRNTATIVPLTKLSTPIYAQAIPSSLLARVYISFVLPFFFDERKGNIFE